MKPADVLKVLERRTDVWHQQLALTGAALRELARLAEGRNVWHSVETGAGDSTLLLSHLSHDHVVFAVADDDHLSQLAADPLLNRATVRFVEGPSQVTLPAFMFEHELDLALLDGPHSYPYPELEYYSIYPHLRTGALLIIDNLEIPTVGHLFEVLSEDVMFEPVCVVNGMTGFLRRSPAPTFPRLADDWTQQRYNTRRYPAPCEPALDREFIKRWTQAGRAVKQLLVRGGGRLPTRARRYAKLAMSRCLGS